MHTLHSRAAQIFKWWRDEAEQEGKNALGVIFDISRRMTDCINKGAVFVDKLKTSVKTVVERECVVVLLAWVGYLNCPESLSTSCAPRLCRHCSYGNL